jgi:hypothetical protein
MTDRPGDLETILTDVRRRWTLRSLLRAWTVGTAAAAVVVLAALVATLVVAGHGIPLVVTAAVATTLSAAALGYALWPCRRTPSNRQIARYIEERAPELDDVVVTAVDASGRPEITPRMRNILAADAARALDALSLDVVVSPQSVRQAGLRAAAATVALGIALAMFAPALWRATGVASAYMFPARLTVEVTPGAAKVRAGQAITIAARLSGAVEAVVPTVTIGVGKEERSLRMAPAADGSFALTIDKVTAPFTYAVTAAATRSGDYAVTVIHPPRVERIDVRYEFPRGLGLEARTDEDSGDIYGPAGTSVSLAVTADKPITSAALVLADGTKVPLAVAAQSLSGGLTIEEDGSYRIALTDIDGLESAGDTEYFIRTMDDRPPDVRILRPASDKHVTPLEEVQIEARADDDYGIQSFELVFQTAKGKERVVPLRGQRGGLTASALHTLFMEDLGVQPGDFVTYFARARDVSRGRRATEARSDIFFLEVKPFEEEFVAAQSSSMGQGAGRSSEQGLEALAEAQKQIIVATWKLDARARRARDASSQQDVKAVAKAQSELRARAEQAGAQASRTSGDPRRRRGLPGTAPGEDPLGRAVEAMGRAVSELDRVSTTAALPHEMEALNQLLKAIAEARRREVTRSQQAGGGGGSNRAEADLSSLFDQELRKRQSTNYETPNSTEERQDEKQDDLLERIRELARRQDALNRQHRDLAQNRDRLDEAELKRQLERLTREQNELRRQAEQLAQRMQQQQQAQGQQSQSGQSSGQPSGQSGSGQQDSRQLREISEDMRNAETGMRRQDSQQASNSGSRASDRLRDLERQMQASKPDDRRRALGDLQLETRQLADAQRRLNNEAGRTDQGSAGDDARRRLAGEQERLADRTDRLQEQVKRMSRAGQGGGDDRQATDDAARELERQKLAERMRQSAEALRQSGAAGEQQGPAPDATKQMARQGEDVARALDRIADRLGAASGAQDRDSRRLSDQLSKAQELRDKLASLERSVEELKRQEAQQLQASQAGNGEPQGQAQSANGQPQPPRQGPQQAQGSQGGQQGGSQASASGRDGASGEQGGSAGGNGGRVQQLQRDVNDSMRDAARLADEIRRDSGMQSPNPNDGWWRSFSAPGTEAFKQDFARWESLKKNLLVALEDVETKVSHEIRTRENKERLNAGGHDAVSDAYRDLVDKYYRSLATPRKK